MTGPALHRRSVGGLGRDFRTPQPFAKDRSYAHSFRTGSQPGGQQRVDLTRSLRGSGYDRYLREGDEWSRRKAVIADRNRGRRGWGKPTTPEPRAAKSALP
jgi:hypothetical protein